MLTFKKYSSIENTYNKEFLDKIKSEGLDSLQYVVQEKVHGANCCLITDGQAVHFGKRTGWVEPGEKFYNYEELLERYKDKAIHLFFSIKEKYTDTISIAIYGEMFGGKYPHPEVKNDSKIMCNKKGVFYCPNHEFYGFDLFIKKNEDSRYLSVDEANQFFEKSNFLYAKTLLQGSLEECLQYPNAFQSHVAEWLGLPALEDNICEGIVIRPVNPVFFNNGSRLLLKSKNSKFAEKKSVKKRQPTLFVEPTYSEELNQLLGMVEDYVTENRLNNVISKIGQVSIPKDVGKLIGLLSKDVLEDFLKENSGKYAFLEKSEQKILNRHINKLATDLIKKVYMNQ
jgi:Rnl2 family RNA ligase